MDLFRNVISVHKRNEHSSPKLSSERPPAATSDTRLDSRSASTGGNQVSKPSAGPRPSTSGDEPSALEVQVQQLCEIFPEVPRNEIKSMLVRYSYNTELVASVLVAHGTDSRPRAAGTPSSCPHCSPHCSPQCPSCGGRMVKTPQRRQYAQQTYSRTAMPQQGQNSGAERYRSTWGSERSTSQPFNSGMPSPTQGLPLEGDNYGEDG